VDPREVEMLEDLIISAIKEALKESRDLANGKMNSITGGMGGFPGLM
jgi:DNA-binding protein YbaB